MNLKTLGRTSSVSNAARINPDINAQNIRTWTIKNDTPINNETMLADRVLDDYMISTLPSAGQEIKNPTMLKQDLEYLNRKLETVRKTVTAWDVYNILGVAETAADVNQLLNTLSPNSSFIVNTANAYQIGKKTYSVGDIVFKDIVGQNHIIKAQGAGVFFPQNLDQSYIVQKNATEPSNSIEKALWNKIKDKTIVLFSEITLTPVELETAQPSATEDDLQNAIKNLVTNSTFLVPTNTWKLTYTFSTTIPSETDQPVEMAPNADIGYHMQKDLLMQNENLPYGYHEKIQSHNSLSKSIQVNNIQPVIYTYLLDDKNNRERIWLDDSCYAYTSNTINITNNTPFTILVEVR